MSYAMTHLKIADGFVRAKAIDASEYFMLGSISPDAVHSRSDFSFELKARAHDMQPEEKWGQVYKEAAMNIWYDRIRVFYKDHFDRISRDSDPRALAFLQGYTHHMLVDVFNCKLLYAPNLIRYDFEVDRMRDRYRADCIIQDNYIYQNWESSEQVWNSLKETANRPEIDEILAKVGLDHFICADDIKKSIDFNLGGYLKVDKADLKGLEMVSEEGTKRFVEVVTAETVDRLYSFPDVNGVFSME